MVHRKACPNKASQLVVVNNTCQIGLSSRIYLFKESRFCLVNRCQEALLTSRCARELSLYCCQAARLNKVQNLFKNSTPKQ